VRKKSGSILLVCNQSLDIYLIKIQKRSGQIGGANKRSIMTNVLSSGTTMHDRALASLRRSIYVMSLQTQGNTSIFGMNSTKDCIPTMVVFARAVLVAERNEQSCKNTINERTWKKLV